MTHGSVAKEVTIGDLQNDVSASLRDVDQQAVRVVREAGQGDLVVTTEDRLVRQIEALRSAGRVITRHIGAATKGNALVSEFSWAASLPDHDAEIFYNEILAAINIDDVERSVDCLLVLLDQWRATADVWADPELCEELCTPIEDHGSVTA